MTFNPCAIIGEDGPIARRLGERFEKRPQQEKMISAVSRAMSARKNLLVEAGTGVGKSFAYLLPAIEQVINSRKNVFDDSELDSIDILEDDTKTARGRQRVVVSTHTIALQEQLINKDIPLLQQTIGDEFSAVLVKGRGNYLSRRRLSLAKQRQYKLFSEHQTLSELEQVRQWASQTADGSRAHLPEPVGGQIWEKVQSDSTNCLGKKCPTYDSCFYQQARRRARSADILVVNHALFFADLALRAQGASLLPAYDHVILDEAHTVEDVASEHFGATVTEAQVRFLLSNLYQFRTDKGFLPSLKDRIIEDVINAACNQAMQARKESDKFFDSLARYKKEACRSNGRIEEPDVVENSLSGALKGLALRLGLVRDEAKSDSDRTEINGYIERCNNLAAGLDILVSQKQPDSVYWLEVSQDRAPRKIRLTCSPIDVAPLLKEHLFEAKGASNNPLSVILTSATLATPSIKRSALAEDGEGREFAHLKNRLGCGAAKAIKLGSPFDYQNQVKLIVDSTIPAPASGKQYNQRSGQNGAAGSDSFFESICPAILREIDRSDGGAFVLFTSYFYLQKVAEKLKQPLAQRQMQLLVQGDGRQRSKLLEIFKDQTRAVLFGTASFWQGVDVPGNALRNVIITRLPFTVPDQPLIEARTQRIQDSGGNPFMEYSLPEAILRFKQGFGRLIRTHEDKGTVAVLDSRIVNKFYGKKFIEALPDIPIEQVQATVQELEYG